MLSGLENKTVLITGAACGIGRATAVAFADCGANVVVNHLQRRPDADVIVDLVRQAGGRALTVEADVCDPLQVNSMAKQAQQCFGTIDVLVNNAGMVLVKPFLQTTAEDWRTVIDTDLTPVFPRCQAVLPGMLKKGGGSVINIVSELACLGRDRYCVYTAAKGGVLSLTRSLAREFAPMIRAGTRGADRDVNDAGAASAAGRHG